LIAQRRRCKFSRDPLHCHLTGYRFLLVFAALIIHCVLPSNLDAQEVQPSLNTLDRFLLPDNEESGGQDTPQKESSPLEVGLALEKGSSAHHLPLPMKMSDGRELRPIALYSSQMDVLVSKEYMPVSINQFRDALLKQSFENEESLTNQVIGSQFVVELLDSKLVCRRGWLELSRQLTGSSTVGLGRQGVSIRSTELAPNFRAESKLPRLQFDAEGRVFVTVGDEISVQNSVDYLWTAQGKLIGNAIDFKLRLPLVEKSTFFVAIPTGLELVAQNVVGTKLNEFDTELRQLIQSDDCDWYKIEAGGVSEVSFQVIDSRQINSSFPIVRRSQMRCDLHQGGIDWTNRVVLERSGMADPLEILIQSDEILSVKLDGENVPFSLLSESDGRKRLRIKGFDQESRRSSLSATLSIQGFKKNITTTKPVALPQINLLDCVNATTAEEILVSVLDPFQIVQWRVPNSWATVDEQGTETGTTSISLAGPLRENLIADSNAVKIRDQDSSTSQITNVGIQEGNHENELVSVLLALRPIEVSTEVDLSLNVDETAIFAKSRMAINLGEKKDLPITLQIENEWDLNTVRFEFSGRLIAVSEGTAINRSIDLWPESQDIDGDQLVIIAEGKRDLKPSQNQLDMPSTWFVRTSASGVTTTLASVTPVAALTWSGETALARSKIDEPSLDKRQEKFFDSVGSRTLWFAPKDGGIPAVKLVRPSVAYSIKSRLFVTYEEGQVVENLIFQIASQSQSIGNLVVRTGAGNELPEYQWASQKEDGSDEVQINRVFVSPISNGVSHELDLKDLSLDGRLIVAKRRFPIMGRYNLLLPTCLGSTSQDAEVFLDPAFVLVGRSDGVSVVPNTDNLGADYFQIAGKSSASSFFNRWMRLRYDPVNQPSIEISSEKRRDAVNLVWKERVKCVASVNGADQLHAEYHLRSNTNLEIKTPDGWDLVSHSVSQDQTYQLDSKERQLHIPPSFREEIVHVTWERKHDAGFLYRTYEVPSIELTGAVVISSQYRLIPRPDSFVVDQLFPMFQLNQQVVNSLVAPQSEVLLCRYEHVLAFGCLGALTLCATSCWIGRRSIFLAFVFFVIACTASFFWTAFAIAYFAWIVVPVVVGVIFAITTKQKEFSGGRRSGNQTEETSGLQRNSDSDFSFTDAAGKVFLLGLAIAVLEQTGSAQDSSPIATEFSNAPVNVLVPVDREGDLTGEMVYIPKDIYSTLFAGMENEVENPGMFLSANYRVSIAKNNDLEAGQLDFERVEADYVIEYERSNASVSLTLPLLFDTVRRIELLGDGTRILPFDRDGRFVQLSNVALDPVFKIRVTYKPVFTTQDAWEKLELSIPAIANAKITIESTTAVSALRLGGVQGWLIKDQANLSSTWVDDLGPTNLLQLDARAASGGQPDKDAALGRRYWIRAGKNNVVIDCELDVPELLVSGEKFQFVILDSRMPRLIGDSWKLVSSELYSPSRRLITLQSVNGRRDPIRMVWSQAIEWKKSDEDLFAKISIPEAIASAMGENADPWIALQCESTVQFMPVSNAENEPLSVDQFVAGWNGYVGSIDRAFVPVDGIPEVSLRYKPKVVNTVGGKQIYHAHFEQNRLRVHYQADLLSSLFEPNYARLFVSEDLDIHQISVGGREQLLSSNLVEGGTEYFIRCEGSDIPTVVQVLGSFAFSPNQTVALPDVELVSNNTESEKKYLVTRDYSVAVSEKQMHLLPSDVSRNVEPDLEFLIPSGSRVVDAWVQKNQVSSLENRIVSREFSVDGGPDLRRIDQLLVLSRTERRWMMQAVFQFLDSSADTLCIELPSEWCEDIVVEGGRLIQSLPAIDPNRTVIQIAVDIDSVTDGKIAIQSRMTSGGVNRVGIPNVVMLDVATRSVFAAVPRLVDGRDTAWRTSSVEVAAPPDHLVDDIQFSEYQTYRATNQSYRIDLMPISPTETKAIAFCSDAHVFHDDETLLVLMHWDVYPGDDQALAVDLPKATNIVGAWCNGKEISVQIGKSVNGWSVDLPFALDNYSQTVQLLVRIDVQRDLTNFRLPRLGDLEANTKWLTFYESDTGASVGRDLSVSTVKANRLVALANSVVESVEAVGNSGQFSEADTNIWLSSWVQRYSLLVNSAGLWAEWIEQRNHENDNTSDDPIQIELADRQSSLSDENASFVWDDLSKRLTEAIKKLSDPQLISRGTMSRKTLFPIGGFEGYRMVRVVKCEGDESSGIVRKLLLRRQEVAIPVYPVFVFSCFGLIVLWAQRNQNKVRPFLCDSLHWLIALSIICWIVLPIPVAAGISFLTFMSPVIASSKLINSIAAWIKL